MIKRIALTATATATLAGGAAAVYVATADDPEVHEFVLYDSPVYDVFTRRGSLCEAARDEMSYGYQKGEVIEHAVAALDDPTTEVEYYLRGLLAGCLD